jgi:predicted kinase
MKPTLHFFCGKIAAGKTTLSMRLAEQHQAVLISEDIWLRRLYPTEILTFQDYLNCAQRLKSVVAPHVVELLGLGVNVVLDFPANVPSARLWVRGIFERAGANHTLHYLNTSEARCIEQLKQRNQDLPEGSVAVSLAQFEYISSLFVEPSAGEGFQVAVYGA